MSKLFFSILLVVPLLSFSQIDTKNSERLKSLIINSDFEVTKNVKNIDSTLLQKLEKVADANFYMANPNEPWDASCTRFDPNLPRTQLQWFAKVNNLYVLTFTIGGFRRSTVCYLFELSPNKSICYAGRLNNYYEKDIERLKFKKFKKSIKNGIIKLNTFDNMLETE